MGHHVTCQQCQSTSVRKDVHYPHRTAGCLLGLLGLCLAPFIIGVFIILYAWRLESTPEGRWVCNSCGTTWSRVVSPDEAGGISTTMKVALVLTAGALAVLFAGMN